MSSFSPTLRRSFTSSLFATERNPKIIPRTDLDFHKLSPAHADRNYLLDLSHHWKLKTYERSHHSTDAEMRELFDRLSKDLDNFHDKVLFNDLGIQGREIYLCRNTSTRKIESVAFGREWDGPISISPHVICVDPELIPNDFQTLNQSELEGPDSYLVRMMVKFAASFKYPFIGFSVMDKRPGYENIIFQSEPADERIFSEGYLAMKAEELDFRIHGTDAPQKFESLFIKNLSKTI